MNLTGDIYYFTTTGAPIKDTDYNRQMIIKSVKPAYINSAAKIEFNHIIPHKNRGFCIPSNKGAAFAIDFIPKQGFIHQFIVGSSVDCRYLQ